MDVERIQKVNNLALDLMKQGLASDREEAIAKAEHIFKDRDTEDYAEIRRRMDDTPERRKQEVDSNSLTQDQIKEILEKNTTFIIKRFKEMQEKMEFLEREVSHLKNKSLQRGATTVNQERVSNPQEQKEQETEVRQGASTETNHPRSGNYKEDDVSIEKFFYMGNK